MFESVSLAPPDAIFGLNEAMSRDARPNKINLGAGVYKDESGKTPILEVVKEAERRLLEGEITKSYLPIDGSADYAQAVRELVLGPDHGVIRDGRAVTVHAPGGTGALRVMGELMKTVGSSPKVWLSNPTWANHAKIFAAAGLETRSYGYYDPESRGLDFESMLASLEEVQAGDMVVLHGCCHNPSGVDPSFDQWTTLGQVLARRGALPLIDFAYHGFVDGTDEDARAIRHLADQLEEMVICSSFSKNFGLYAERVGAATLITGSSKQAGAVLSQAKTCVRAFYSNPPMHGAAVVTTVLNDTELRRRWEEELADMRHRIQKMRVDLAAGLSRRNVRLHKDGNDFIVRQNGMFSFSGLTEDEVDELCRDHAVYILASGRINVAGITESNIDRLCDAIAQVRAG